MKFDLFMQGVTDLRLDELRSLNEFLETNRFVVYHNNEHASMLIFSLVDKFLCCKMFDGDDGDDGDDAKPNESLLSLKRKIYILHAFFTQYGCTTVVNNASVCQAYADFVDYSVKYILQMDTAKFSRRPSLSVIFRYIIPGFKTVNGELEYQFKPYISIFLLSKIALLFDTPQDDPPPCFIRGGIEEALKYFPEFDITRLSLQQRFDVISLYHSTTVDQMSSSSSSSSSTSSEKKPSNAKKYALFNQSIILKFLNVYSTGFFNKCRTTESIEYQGITCSPGKSKYQYNNPPSNYDNFLTMVNSPMILATLAIRFPQIRFPKYITYKEKHLNFIFYHLVHVVNAFIVVATLNPTLPKQAEFITSASLLVFGPNKTLNRGGGATCEMRMIEQLYNRVVDRLYNKNEGKEKNEIIRTYIHQLKRTHHLSSNGYPLSEDRTSIHTSSTSKDDIDDSANKRQRISDHVAEQCDSNDDENEIKTTTKLETPTPEQDEFFIDMELFDEYFEKHHPHLFIY